MGAEAKRNGTKQRNEIKLISCSIMQDKRQKGTHTRNKAVLMGLIWGVIKPLSVVNGMQTGQKELTAL
jgi:hypothetical protein